MNARNQPDIILISREFWEIMDGELCQWQTMDPTRRQAPDRLPLDHRFQSFKRRLSAAIARRREA